MIKNTMGEIEFAVRYIIYSALAIAVYEVLMEGAMDDLGREERIFKLAILFCNSAAFILQIGRRRNEVSILMNIALACGIYAAIIYFPERKKIILITMIVALLLSILMAKLIFRKPEKKNFRKSLMYQMTQLMAATQLMFAVCMIIMIALIFAAGRMDRVTIQKQSVEDMREKNNAREIVVYLKDYEWEKLSQDERLKVLGTITDYECDYLGMEDNIGRQSGGGTVGMYVQETDEILIRPDVLQYSGEKSLEVLLHEIRHMYQWQLIELYQLTGDKKKDLKLFDEIRTFEYENNHYENDDYEAYYSQKCEEDAREYSARRIKEYYSPIYSE